MEEIEIEIRNPSRLTLETSVLLDVDESVRAVLASLRESLVQFATTFLKGKWTSIAFHGRVSKVSTNDRARTTIIVFVDPNARADYTSIQSALDNLLIETNARLAGNPSGRIFAELLPGFLLFASPADAQPKIYTSKLPHPETGSSISLREDEEHAGTLGGFVYFHRNGRKVPCALTCYHVLRSVDPSAREKTDESGNDLNGSDGRLDVQSPAPFDVRESFRYLRKMMELGKKPVSKENKELLNHYKVFSQSPPLGKVLAASGLTTKNRSRMDWALVELHSSQAFGKNRAAPASSFNVQACYGIDYTITESWEVQNFGKAMVSNSWVAKIGRTSGCTSGNVNALGRLIPWQQHAGWATEEVEVMGTTTNFACGGDSGSFVTNEHGELVGLLIGKDSFSADFDCGFVTPIKVIQEHIKEMTGGTITLQ